MLSYALIAVGLDISPMICLRCCKCVLCGGGVACGEGMADGAASRWRAVYIVRDVLCDCEGAGEGSNDFDKGFLVCCFKRGGREMLGLRCNTSRR